MAPPPPPIYLFVVEKTFIIEQPHSLWPEGFPLAAATPLGQKLYDRNDHQIM